jgi:ankyrin repeat protein
MVCIFNSGKCEIVKLLLSKGADVNSHSQGGTPLHIAAVCGFDDAMEILLDHHADVSLFILPCFASSVNKLHVNCY